MIQSQQPQQQVNQQGASSSQSEISEMMRLQKEMFSGMQETMKMQSELLYKTMQQVTAGISNSQGKQPENKLPAQVEKNPKQCGAISTTQAVEAVTTRSGLNTEPILKTPPTATYVVPPRRPREEQMPREEKMPHEEEMPRERNLARETPPEPAIPVEPAAVPVIEKPLVQKIPFPSRLEKTK